jgi:hypothetical protein
MDLRSLGQVQAWIPALVVVLALAPALGSAGCRISQDVAHATPVKIPQRILFVGNSFTYYHGGLEQHVRRLAESAQPPQRLEVERAAKGGATLKILQDQPWVHEKIRDGHFDLVVLQEDIPELTEHSVSPFLEHARRFDQEIRQAGGRTALFMAWPYQRLNWVTLEEIEQAHRAIGRELSSPVAPVGSAFQRSLQARPGLAMLGPDHEHETIHGTYLAAGVLYSVIFGHSPEGLSYHPEGVSDEEAAFLQRVAWDSVQDWQRHR